MTTTATTIGTTQVYRVYIKATPEAIWDAWLHGWRDHYFEPMKAYFEGLRGSTKPAAAKKAAPSKGKGYSWVC